LEDALKVELFTRKSNGLELTDAGREYLHHCSSIFDTCEAAASAAQRAHSTVSGRVRIASSSEFGTSIIGAAAYFVSSIHPLLDFELQMYPNEKLIAGELDFDCMIYVGDPPDSALMQRKMGGVSSGLYASQSLLDRCGTPQTPDEVKKLDGVRYMRNGIPEAWRIACNGQVETVEAYPRFSVNDYWMAKYFAVEGSAIGYLPDFFVRYEVEQAALVPVLPEWRSEKSAIYLIYPAHRHRNPRVMNLVDAMCSRFDEFMRHPGYALIKRDYQTGSSVHDA
jgi:DNA-binding transcriptional LysR family regulator